LNIYFRLGFTFALISAVLIACSNSSSESTNNSGANIIPQNIAAELFKDGGASAGQFDIQGNHLQWVSDGSTVTLTITDPGGSVTQVVVPYGSLAW
jgi:outer membrane biogenesis lipoprotein LolB